MSSTKVFEAIGDFLYNTIFLMYDNIGNLFNYSCIVLGFFGLFYWLRYQKKFNDQAANDPNQLK
ncbi:MAG: hypothetical protein LW701_03440 [Fluviicola sp.]|jgi:hypothetical protein|nr:hypothetical protein [Fluviicola sp.]